MFFVLMLEMKTCLAAYLVRNDYFEHERIDIRVEQGREIGRLGHL
jgi:predicted PhzF superfamily epimerase YddE/YHI9